MLKAAVEQHAWDGSWYRRAYFDDGTPLGTAGADACAIDSIAQSWGVMSGAADPDRARRAMRSLDEHLVRRNLRNLTHCWVDVMEMSSRRANLPSRITIDELYHFTDAIARGNGVVVASMHFGSWEVGLAGWNKMGHKMALLAEVLRPPQLFERVVGARRAQGVHIIPIDTQAMREGDMHVARRLGANSMREVYKVLRSGGVVAMALDRDLIGNGEPLDFFGTPAPIPIGAVEIAIRSGAAVVPILLFRDNYRVHAVVYPEIHYSTDQPRDAEVRKTAEVLLRIFERAIRNHPEQWHVLDPIWADGTP